MLTLIFSLDYEIHGNGEGCPYKLMVEPTDRLLRQFDAYGAKLTIMADVAEIIRFKEYLERSGRDEFHYQAIVDQLRRALRGGHDVQMHIHSSYLNAQYREGRWIQDWAEYNFAGLPTKRMDSIVKSCKDFLETLLRPVDSSYRCFAFRAANWSVSPSSTVVPVLIGNDIQIDTSVFKFGRRKGIVSFDYTSAHHPILPWRADANDICRLDPESPLWEFPIYAEERWIGAFASPHRLYRALLGRLHKVNGAGSAYGPGNVGKQNGSWLARKHAWKADFNQCSGRQLTGSLLRAEQQVAGTRHAPFVLIGHSKLFTRWNERSLKPLLSFVGDHRARFRFGTFGDFENSTIPARDPSAVTAVSG